MGLKGAPISNDALVIAESYQKVLLITNMDTVFPQGGRFQLCRLNYELLKEICGSNLFVCTLAQAKITGVRAMARAFLGEIDGVNEESIRKAIAIVVTQKIKKVFVDGSNLGRLVQRMKLLLPEIEVTTFFHNVEARFFYGACKAQKTWRSLAVMFVNYLAERKAVLYSDKRICLNRRDSELLKKLYGQSATHLSPMAMEDRCSDKAESPPGITDRYLLFVGANFYANRLGISWFVEKVAPFIDIKTYVVGRGFEEIRAVLERPGKVEVVGSVDNVNAYYENAYCVLAPIFDGSGMKTKVAEALMFGKKVIGTPEAFVGYEDVAAQIGWVCSTPETFIRAIKESEVSLGEESASALRELYLQYYSRAAAHRRLLNILDEHN